MLYNNLGEEKVDNPFNYFISNVLLIFTIKRLQRKADSICSVFCLRCWLNSKDESKGNLQNWLSII